jgi:cation:H+ antiporter
VAAPLLLAVALVVVLGGALLFTNAVEWTGVKLGLGAGAVGSVVAAVATAVPESVIPVIAVIVGGEQSQDVAIGAVVGAPFMLATIAMALVGVTALIYERRRPQRLALRAHRPTLKRDLGFFLTLFATAAALGFGAPRWLRVVAAVMFIAAYAAYATLTVRGGGEVQAEEDVAPLTFDTTKRDPPRPLAVGLQFVAGLGLIVGGAHLFVEELVHVADWEFGAMTFLACALALSGGALALFSLHVRARFTRPTIVAWTGLFATFVVAVVVSA